MIARMSAVTAPDPVPQVSLVVPLYNEQDNVRPFTARALAVLDEMAVPYELVFVDDGSTDQTAALVAQLAAEHPAVRCVALARNFGHQAALVAGLDAARGAAVITMDGDLQHPPELLPRLVEQYRAGAEIVQAVRRAPADLSATKRAGSRWFYRLLAAITRLELRPGASDFRLMARPAVQAFLACPERCRFNRGLVQWIGFRRCEVVYEAERRFAGVSKYTWRGMFRLAGDAIFSFSSLPLRLAGLAGAGVSLVAAGYLVFVLLAYFFTDRTEVGWSSLVATVLILGGMNLIVLWILGEYVGRLYEETKQRPLYVLRPPEDPAGPAPVTPRAAPGASSRTAAPG